MELPMTSRAQRHAIMVAEAIRVEQRIALGAAQTPFVVYLADGLDLLRKEHALGAACTHGVVPAVLARRRGAAAGERTGERLRGLHAVAGHVPPLHGGGGRVAFCDGRHRAARGELLLRFRSGSWGVFVVQPACRAELYSAGQPIRTEAPRVRGLTSQWAISERTTLDSLVRCGALPWRGEQRVWAVADVVRAKVLGMARFTAKGQRAKGRWTGGKHQYGWLVGVSN
jgi:hypothetical protein